MSFNAEETKLFKGLNKSKEELQKNADVRTVKRLKRQQESLLDSLEADKEELLAKIDVHQNEDSVRNSDSTWNTTLLNYKVDLQILEKSIEIAKQLTKELF